MRSKNAQVADVFDAATDALRWVADAAVPAEGGATWPVTRATGRVGAMLCDDLYDGTAGVLVAFAEARLSGIADYDEHARAAAGRLRHLARAGHPSAASPGPTVTRSSDGPDLTLYSGLSGIAAALRIWAEVSGDLAFRQAASNLIIGISEIGISHNGISDIEAAEAGADERDSDQSRLGQPNSTRPDPGQPDPGQPDPGRPHPGHPDPGQPDPGQPDPGQSDPGQSDPGQGVRDLIEGDAGVLLTLARLGSAAGQPAASALADQIVADARWVDGQPDWPSAADHTVFKPNFSHGAAGIAFALAAASGPLDRPDLLTVAQRAANRLVSLGTRPEGTLAVPYSLPVTAAAQPHIDTEVSYGWCHGPTGTMRLFQLLDRLQPTAGWAAHVHAGRRAVRASGLPARLYPGFWDNLGQCCGTAGVGEMALDAYQETGDPSWLVWAGELAADVLGRRITDGQGTRWSNTEYRATPPELEPMTGWMQGTAGVAGWLLRLARVYRDGLAARRIIWPDHVGTLAAWCPSTIRW
jgi:lantibiotic modifying enzyme